MVSTRGLRKSVRVRLCDTPIFRDFTILFEFLEDEACRIRFRFRMRSKLVQDDSFVRSDEVAQMFVSRAVRQASEHDRRWFAARTEPVPARNRFGTSFLRFFGPPQEPRAADIREALQPDYSARSQRLRRADFRLDNHGR